MPYTVYVRPTGTAEPCPVMVSDPTYGGRLDDDPLPSGVTIGSNPLGDADDDTYVETRGGEGGVSGAEWIGYYPLPATDLPSGWWEAAIWMRYMQLPGSGLSSGGRKSLGGIDVNAGDVADVSDHGHWAVHHGSSGNYNIVEVNAWYHYIEGGEDRTVRSWADVIREGNAGIAAHIDGTPHRVIDLWVQFWYPGDPPTRTLTTAPRRLTQRGDGLAGGAPRLTGSRSRQASNRLLGGYL